MVLTALHFLKRRTKARTHANSGPKEEVSELDASSTVQSPESLPSKAGYTDPEIGTVHEIASGRTEIPAGVHELDDHATYDWEPRNEPQPRDGGFRPGHSEH